MIPIPKPQNPNSLADQFINFVEVVKILRSQCPWDKAQTKESIAHLMIEEVYEAVDAIEKNDNDDLSKELGDLLLHIVMHSIIAEETQSFSMMDVLKKIQDKMIKRHPHVFSDVQVDGQEEVLRNWEEIKMNEGQESALQGVPIALPALIRAERIQHKASRVGFDWERPEDMWVKVEEEFSEFKNELKNGTDQRKFDEFGDFLFSLVNAARFENIVPEMALQKTNNKFTKRFQYIEKRAMESGKSLKDMTLAEMDVFWDEAKLLE
ncbi:MAG: nucleoside triphosphate pyrophosphohydrolase [Candidatus Kapabacteria bacterium]|nr:nucleoside triphosphate pyrophosphohydrolase [Candidatus Kapabacteria bacterium]